MRVLPLLFFFALLFDRHMVPNGTPGNRAHDGVMVREMSCHATDNSTFQAACFGGGAYDAQSHGHRDNIRTDFHLLLHDLNEAFATSSLRRSGEHGNARVPGAPSQ
jgi:hypothetical protein